MNNLLVEETDNSVVFKVKVVPGSSRTVLCGLHGDMVKIKVAAAPEKGKANKCLLDFLAKRLGVKRNSVSISSGKTSEVKFIRVTGMSTEQLLNKIKQDKQNSCQ